MKKNYIVNPKTIKALTDLSEQMGGLLKPLDVVESAKSETSPLHEYFEWDNTVAAEKYRLTQARELIQRVSVRVVEPTGERIQSVFVSLSSDRVEGGGYRTLIEVVKNKSMRAQLVADALNDMRSFEQKYRELERLASVFDAMHSVEGELVKSS